MHSPRFEMHRGKHAPFLSLVLILLVTVRVIIADYDPNISNGACYYAPGKQLDKSYLPCGNADGGHLPCCEARDKCLSSLACYSDIGTTYLAGCTDESYSDELCPDKGIYANNSWAGMIDCPLGSAEWYVCDDDGLTVTTGAPCSCETQTHAAFTDAPTLTSILGLPYGIGNSISWVTYNNSMFNGHILSTSFGADYYSSIAGRNAAPSRTPSSSSAAAAASSLSASRSTLTSINATTTSPPIVSSPNTVFNVSTTLSPPSSSVSSASGKEASHGFGRSIGIGLGTAAGAFSLGLSMWAAIFCLRKKRRNTGRSPDALNSATSKPVVGEDKGKAPIRTTYTQDVEKSLRSPAWSGHKSELSADETTMSPAPTYHEWGSSARSSRLNVSPNKYVPPSGRQRASELPGDVRSGVYEMPG